jgi:DGQHR domain-containing protein
MKNFSLRVPVLRVTQPIGEFFVGVISAKDLIEISSADIRRIEGDLDRYVGIQRKLSEDRVKEIGAFVNSIDATFPTSIVLSIPGSCAEYDEKNGFLVLKEGINEDTDIKITSSEIANILDGQHRIEGLKAFQGKDFDLTVSIFVEADIADEAYIFATVNLAQTKVNRSLVYDLLDFAKARSPQKSCHDIAVALDKHKSSPFYKMIKRLGTATPGRTGETLAQATFVSSLIPLISTVPLDDRERLARGKSVKTTDEEYSKTPFRALWVEGRDADITRILIEYFSAISETWPNAWKSRERGNILPRTNGFRASMRFLKNAYLHFLPKFDSKDFLISRSTYRKLFNPIKLQLSDDDLNSNNFIPGSTGEKKLYETFRELAKI